MNPVDLLNRAVTWLCESHGSTRTLGLFRILLVFLLWTRFAEELAPWNARDPVWLVTGLAFFALSLSALIGWQTRRVMALLAAVMALVYFHLGWNLGHTPFTHHHVYLLFACTLYTALGPCDRSFSLDRWLALKHGNAAPEQGNLLTHRLMQLQLAAVYFWTAVDKTNTTFLSGVRLDQILHFHYIDTLLDPVLLWPPLILVASVGVVVVEYFLSIAILLRRWLPAVFLLGFALHATFYLLLPVQTFSATMVAMYIFLIPPERFHSAVDRLVGAPPGPAGHSR